MALISCPECAAEISSQATACIRCGFPLSRTECVAEEGSELEFAATEEPLAEDVVFRTDIRPFVEVTPTRIIVERASYALRNVNAVEKKKATLRRWALAAATLGGLLLLAWVPASGLSGAEQLLVAAAVVMAIAVVLWIRNPRFQVILRTNNEDAVIATSESEPVVSNVVDAIERSLRERDTPAPSIGQPKPVYFNFSGPKEIRITTSGLVLGNDVHLIDEIAAVRWDIDEPSKGLGVGLLLVALFLLWLTAGQIWGQSSANWQAATRPLVGAIVFGVGGLRELVRKTTYQLSLVTSSGESSNLTSRSRDFVFEVFEGVNRAIALR